MLRLVRSLTQQLVYHRKQIRILDNPICAKHNPHPVPLQVIFITIMADEQQQDHSKPISYGVQKLQLRGVQKDISALENRLSLLRQQQRLEKVRIQNNKSHLKKAVEKKKDIHSVMLLKQRDRSQEVQRVKELAEVNKQKRQGHKEMMEDLLQACYLLKSDEARELKHKSIEHEEAIKNIKEEMYNSKKGKQKMIKEVQDKSRKEYIRFWNQRVKDTIQTNQKGAQEALTLRQQRQRYLKELQKQEIKMLKEIYRTHQQTVDTKKDYITALSVPAQEIAALYPTTTPPKQIPTPTALMELPPKPKDKKVEQYENRKKLPKAIELNEAKLRKVMQSLREQRAQSCTQRTLDQK